MSDAIEIKVNPKELSNVLGAMDESPKDVKKILRKAVTSMRRSLVSHVKKVALSKTTGTSVGPKKKGMGGRLERGELKKSFGKHKRGSGVKGVDRMGFYIRAKWTGWAGVIARWHTTGTGPRRTGKTAGSSGTLAKDITSGSVLGRSGRPRKGRTGGQGTGAFRGILPARLSIQKAFASWPGYDDVEGVLRSEIQKALDRRAGAK